MARYISKVKRLNITLKGTGVESKLPNGSVGFVVPPRSMQFENYEYVTDVPEEKALLDNYVKLGSLKLLDAGVEVDPDDKDWIDYKDFQAQGFNSSKIKELTNCGKVRQTEREGKKFYSMSDIATVLAEKADANDRVRAGSPQE